MSNEDESQVIKASVDTDDLQREKWDRKIEFVFACIGFAVGYGNFWRFPFKCFKNGGGAFLVPFVICLALAGIPLFLLELSVGQLTQAGPLRAWTKICPLSSGLGYAMIFVCFYVSVYYNVILAWSCYYFIHSFIPDIPWVGCHHTWSSPDCIDPFKVNKTFALANASGPSPSRDFFTNNMLQISSSVDDIDGLNWKLVLCLFFAWVMVYFCIWKGIRTTGKIVYVTATAPYVMLIILFIRSLMLDGSVDGIKYYITPKWDRLTDPIVWVDAASQIFYSITIGMGVMLTFASYNKRHNNVFRDALVISVCDAITSIFSGFVVFSILGYMAKTQGKDIEDPAIATTGPGLVFVVYPAALATLPASHVWTVIFFLMLITLGLDSQFGQVELVCACIIEEYPKKLKKYREWIILGTCTVMFIVGLSCVTRNGVYNFNLLDYYSAGSAILFLGICETMVIGYFYGSTLFQGNLEWMIKGKISVLWGIMWKYITPCVVTAIFLFGLSQQKPLTYEKYVYPAWANVIGWIIALSSMACPLVVATVKIIKTEGNLIKRIRVLLQPDKSLTKLKFIGNNTSAEEVPIH